MANYNRSRGGGIQTNLPQIVNATLTYEVEVAFEAMDRQGKRDYINWLWDVTSREFGTYVDAQARSRPKRLHHVYEWNQTGNETARLWRLHKKNMGSNGFRISYNFVQSHTKAPIHPVLAEPGPSGKRVTKTDIFKQKALVMEEDQPVTIRPKRGGYLALPTSQWLGRKNSRGIAFSRGPVRVVHPGGLDTKFGFATTLQQYYRGGVALSQLRYHGAFDKPAKLVQSAGRDIPSAIRRLGINQSISRQAVSRLAYTTVQRKKAGLYG